MSWPGLALTCSWKAARRNPAAAPTILSRFISREFRIDRRRRRVHLRTSGQGSAVRASFNEAHIITSAQLICLYRERQEIDGPLFLARDRHPRPLARSEEHTSELQSLMRT